MNNIEQLLNRYFEGETSLEDEQQIRNYFAQTPHNEVPLEIQKYAPLFSYLKEERETLQKYSVPMSKHSSKKTVLRWIYCAAPIAVAAAILFGVFLTISKPTIAVAEPVITMKVGGVQVEDDKAAKDFANEQMQKLSRMMNKKMVDQKMGVFKKMLLRADNVVKIENE